MYFLIDVHKLKRMSLWIKYNHIHYDFRFKKNKNVTLEKNELDIRKIKLNIFRWKKLIFNIIN